jgi:triosephosphate isomerase
MNGTPGALSELATMETEMACSGVKVVICPPATLIALAAAVAKEIEIGAQDCHAGTGAAFTGKLSPAMLFDAGARWVIVGHSECRAFAGETDDTVREKAERALEAGLAVIVCVGEPKEARDRGEENAMVLSQLAASIPNVAGAALTIAYEPIWAIGTGVTPTSTQIEHMHALIRRALVDLHGDAGQRLPILYGGSANASNATQLLSIAGVDGLLVGGASLSAESFLPIVQAAAARRERQLCPATSRTDKMKSTSAEEQGS